MNFRKKLAKLDDAASTRFPHFLATNQSPAAISVPFEKDLLSSKNGGEKRPCFTGSNVLALGHDFLLYVGNVRRSGYNSIYEPGYAPSGVKDHIRVLAGRGDESWRRVGHTRKRLFGTA